MPTPAAPAPWRIPVVLSCAERSTHRGHPVSAGVPFPRGLLRPAEAAAVRLVDASGTAVPCDAHPLAAWGDGSVKWLLLRFAASGDFGPDARDAAYGVEPGPAGPAGGLAIRESADAFEADTGACVIRIAKSDGGVSAALPDGTPLLAPAGPLAVLEDPSGRALPFRAGSAAVERAGRAAADIVLKGSFGGGSGEPLCRAACRIAAHTGSGLLRIDLTLWNPRPAKHPGGLWDLGDPGSVFFRGLRLAFRPAGDASSARLGLAPRDGETVPFPPGASLHQSGSGDDTWSSLAHVDKDNKPTPKFRGWRLQAPGQGIREGDRATPAVLVPGAGGRAFAAALEDFSEAFPSRLSVEASAGGASVVIEPFPAADGQDFELQGGEKAAKTAWVDLLAEAGSPGGALLPARLRLAALPGAAWWPSTGCVPHLAPESDGEDAFFRGLVDGALSGPNSFFRRRDRFGEYGWRNFGEVAADHEKLHYRGSREFISHYNNQYDLVLAFLQHALRTGRTGWFRLGRDLARHVMHVDLYDTTGDKGAYNGGYFWHTAHYLHAGTATHRTFSRLAAEGAQPAGFGGGPSNEHDYSSGLCLYHLLTGDPEAREAVLRLARWVRDMQDGSRTPFRFFSRNQTGLATATRELAWQGPGRGAGYSINTSLDAWLLTGDPAWLAQAEAYIRTCVHPSDDPDALGLLNREDRWSYVVFLQALGRYLEMKLDEGLRDDAFEYARACLLRYARWMADKEYPYLDKPEELEYPTSTWPAQDLRKTCVFLLAARFGGGAEEARFRERAEWFFARAGGQLAGFDDADSARNLALLLNHVTWMFHHRAEAGPLCLGLPEPAPPPWPKVALVPQKIQAVRNVKRAAMTFGAAGALQLLRYFYRKVRK